MENVAIIDRIVAEVIACLRAVPEPAAAGSSTVDLAPLIDHTLLRPDAMPEDIDRLCDEAAAHRFAAVCVQPCYAAQAVDRLGGSSVAVAAVVGFPHGATLASAKGAEADALVRLGVAELDMVIPVGLLKARRWGEVAAHVDAVVAAARGRRGNRVIVKVIIEAPLLVDAEKVAACVIAEARGADFVKTSTGFGGGGATKADVMLMRRVVGDRLGVKAAGGIRTREQALELLAAGATRLGTSSGPALVRSSGAKAGTG